MQTMAMQTMQKLGRYEILAELGRGAMGAVFRARDPRIDRIVAIKTIAVAGADAAGIEDYRQRFFREAQAAGRLAHPGIVTIFDVDFDVNLPGANSTSQSQSPQTPFIVMEYVDGKPLDEFVAAAPGQKLAQATALDLVRQIAEALHYAHSQGIIHRDIKPANVIVTPDGRAKIADFGIAKLAQTEATLPGHLLGTPAYMSPEQLNGKTVDGRSDLFSLGVIAYWLVTGKKPFDGKTITEVCVQVVTKEPEPATAVVPGLGADFDYVLSRGLAKDPDQRYQRGKDFAADVQDLAAGKPPRSLAAQTAATQVLNADTEKTVALPVAGRPVTAAASQIPTPTAPVGGAAVASSASQAAAAASVNRASAADGAGTLRPARRRTAVFYLLTGAVVMLLAIAVFAAAYNRTLPAELQIVGRYPFSTAEVYIWVDGELRYHDQVHGVSHPHHKFQEKEPAAGETIALNLPVHAGTHTVRVHVDAPGDASDRDTSIPGRFRAYSQKTLSLDFKEKSLNLSWE
jgi:serine/threonine-protein kinase